MKMNALRQFRKDVHGVSVIIGALMLTLIVVTAAVSFAIFTAQKQEELQKAEFAKLLIDSEEISIVGIENMEYNSSSYNLSDVTFVVSSQHLRESKISGFTLNDIVFRRFHIEREDTTKETWNFTRGKFRLNLYVINTSSDEWCLFIDNNFNKIFDNDIDEIYDADFDANDIELDKPDLSTKNYIWLYAEDPSGTPYLFHDDSPTDGTYSTGETTKSLSDILSYSATPGDIGTSYLVNDELKIQSMERIRISLNDIDKNFSKVFFKPITIDNITKNNPIKFDIQTSLTNTFEKVFLPPTPNIEIRREQNSIILDGSDSFCDDDANIIELEWNLTNKNPDPDVYLPIMYGQEINANRILIDDDGVFDFERHDVIWNITLKVKNNYGMLGILNITHVQDFRELMTSIEDIEFIGISPTYDDTFSNVNVVNITIRSNSKYDSNITHIWVNNELHENIVNISGYGFNYSNFSVIDIPLEKPITVKIKTALGNTFEKTFYPPTANFMINFESAKDKDGNITNIPYLDASSSDQVGDAYITKWEWNLTEIISYNYYIDMDDSRTFDYEADIIFEDSFYSGNYSYGVNISQGNFTYIDLNGNSKYDNDTDDFKLNFSQDIDKGNITADFSYRILEENIVITNFINDYFGRIVRADILDSDESFMISVIITNNYGLKAKKTISYPE
jgi:hypothetical protein